MITGINELKTLTKHISCECKCKIHGRKCSSSQSWNNNNGWECDVDGSVKNIKHVKKIIFEILLHAVTKMVNT